MSSRIFLLSIVAAAFASGCYDGELDASLDRAYVCEVDLECALGSACIDSVCQATDDDNSPKLQLITPSSLQPFAMGDLAAIPVVISGSQIALTSQPIDAKNAGYIDVLLDGAVAETVTGGDLVAGVQVATIAMPQTPGLHHISLVARSIDGTAFPGDAARVSTGFWVDDGAEHIGILSPGPGDEVMLGEENSVGVEVVSLNFTLANPGFVSPEELQAPAIGYVHLFLDADVPGCLPACNFEHQSAIHPPGLSKVNRITVDQGFILPDEIGTIQLQVVAQKLGHGPYARQETGREETMDFVFHSVPVHSIVQVQQ